MLPQVWLFGLALVWLKSSLWSHSAFWFWQFSWSCQSLFLFAIKCFFPLFSSTRWFEHILIHYCVSQSMNNLFQEVVSSVGAFFSPFFSNFTLFSKLLWSRYLPQGLFLCSEQITKCGKVSTVDDKNNVKGNEILIISSASTFCTPRFVRSWFISTQKRGTVYESLIS